MRISTCLPALLLAGALPVTARAAPGSGTLADPLLVDAFPYVLASSTADAPPSAIDSYACASSTDESGPERVFRFTLLAPARVTGWVEGDGGGVDIDVQLLDTPTLSGSEATDCVARGNVIAEAELGAGEHYAVVDSYNGPGQAGPFVLHLEAIGDAWIERTIAGGVSWRARRFADLGGPQVVNELVVDTLQSGVEIRAIAATGCQTVPVMGEAAGAVAGVNGGYFGLGGGCPPVSLLIASGSLFGTNSQSRGAFGLSAAMAPLVELVAGGQDWPAAEQAHGGGPILVVDSVAQSGASTWATEGIGGAGFLGPNPRTFAGFDANGRSHLATVDGRHDNASGMSLDAEAAFAASAEIDLDQAVNLDGGGSSALWIAGATPNGVVNYPSDAGSGAEKPDHSHPRACSGGLFVFAPPYNHPPRFQTDPLTAAVAGSPYLYDADAIDLDPADTISFALLEGPAGMSVDPLNGELGYAPTAASPPSATVSIEAADDRGASTVQSFTLSIEGGLGGGGGAGGGLGGGGGGGGDVAGVLPGGDASGCGCRVAGRGQGQPWRAWLLLWLAGPVAAARRRRLAAAQPTMYMLPADPCRILPEPAEPEPNRVTASSSADAAVVSEGCRPGLARLATAARPPVVTPWVQPRRRWRRWPCGFSRPDLRGRGGCRRLVSRAAASR